MSRNLILCFDGTNNEYAATNTNVVKLYAMVDRTDANQLMYYQPGIGTFAPPGVWGKTKQWFIKRLDLAVAWLLSDHVTDGYRFLMRYYQPGDNIFIFGFSRGAYTARALAAMLHKVGLLTAGNEELIPFAWDIFKNSHDKDIYDGFRHTFARTIPIHFLGVWDTVRSVGWFWNPEYLQYTANNPSVEILRHAIALDERRAYFVQNLWTKEPPPTQDILEVWFPGVHCDVGGGYVEHEAGLSKIALQWMVEHAKAAGLRFQLKAEEQILPSQDNDKYVACSPVALKHESLKGWWWIAEYIPKQIRDPARNFAARYIIPRGRHRFVGEGAKIHTSVFDRMKKMESYKPKNLPAKFEEIRPADLASGVVRADVRH